MLKSKTIADHVYESLRRDIITLAVHPGEKLSEVQLADRYGVSRAPVRDALRKLQQDKLVIVKPQIGTIVASISPTKAKDISQIRMLLEPFAAESAAGAITDEDLALLEAQFEKLATAPTDDGLRYETDSLLHKTIWRNSGNQEISHILDGFMDEIHRMRIATAQQARRGAPSTQEMRAIFAALKSRDGEAAREAMRLHISNLSDALAGVLSGGKA